MIQLITCQPNYKKLGSDKREDYEKFERVNTSTDYIFFPETEKKNLHPSNLFWNSLKLFKDYIKGNHENDLIVVSCSDAVFNALRVAVHQENYESAICTQIRNDGTYEPAKIFTTGKLSYYMDNVFDTFENTLNILLDID